MSTLASRMRARREELGLGVRELARLAGGSHADISKIEAGVQLRPGAEKLSRYASALKVSAEWLLHGSDLDVGEAQRAAEHEAAMEQLRAAEAAREAEHDAAMKEMATAAEEMRQTLADIRAAKADYGVDRPSLLAYVNRLQAVLLKVPEMETARGKAIAAALSSQFASILAEADQLADELRSESEPVAKENPVAKT